MDKAVVLLSGGIDSTTLLYYVKNRLMAKRIYALSFNYGQRHAREIDMARWQSSNAEVAEHKVIDMAFFGKMIRKSSVLTNKSVKVPNIEDLDEHQRKQPPTYVPNRNMVFISIAAAYAETIEAYDIFYGAQKQDEYGYWDCSKDFITKINQVFRLNRRKAVKIYAPFAGMRKSKVLKIGLELGVDYEHTWSCYRGERKPCGKCPSCVEKERAFKEGGI